MFRFSLFGIPIVVEGWFWLTALFVSGGLHANTSEDWLVVAVRAAVVFVSIVVHELGHAMAGRRYGADPAIKLHGFGGATFLPGGRFSRGESIAVSAAGPAAGLALGLVALMIVRAGFADSVLAREALGFALFVNFYWTALNLLPIQPLDGGQILREILGPRNLRLTAWIGFVLAVVACIWSLMQEQIFLAVLLAMLAYYNFRQEPIEGGVMKP